MVTGSSPPTIRTDEDAPVSKTDANIGTRERWIDAHSVTCAICGDLADEREIIKLYDQNTELEGEAHPDCWDEHNES